MTRMLGPDESYRLVYLTDGTARAQGLIGRLYADEAGTIAADLLDLDGNPVPVVSGAAQRTIDTVSKWPRVQYPDGVDTIYGSVNGGPIVPLLADIDSRIDALAATVAAQAVTIAGKVSSVSPALTGVPTAPTAAGGTNTTQIATTAFVAGEVAAEATARAGADSSLSASITAEATARASADTALSNSISAETTARTNADAALTPQTRSIATTAPLAGGGDLSANRTLSVAGATTGAVGVVQLAGDLGGTATSPTVPGLATRSQMYTTQTKTADFTAAPWFLYLVDTTSGAVTATLPAANVAGQRLAVKWAAGANPANLTVTGGDTIGSAATTATLGLAGEVWEFVSSGAGQWNLVAGNKTQASLDGRYVQVATIDAKGDLLVGTGDNAVARLAIGADGTAPRADASQTTGMKWVVPVDRVYATSSGTWTNPSPNVAKVVRVRGMNAGSGGGAGRRGAAGSLRTGGAGAACGTPFEMWFLTTDLPSTVSYSVGAGGSGAPAVTTDNTDGGNGSSGGNTFFGPSLSTYRAFSATSSAGGGRGGNSTGAATGGTSLHSGPAGAASSATGGAGSSGGVSTVTNGLLMQIGTGGGSGGGITTGDVTSAGGVGGAGAGSVNAGTAGSAGGGNGGDAPAGPIVPSTGGLGGGGGGSSTTSAAGKGGGGAFPGGGGGGGGASLNGFNSGGGGDGAGGYIDIVTFL